MFKRLFSSPSMIKLGERVGIPAPVMTEAELHAMIAEKIESLPFFVERTAYGKGLPVYGDIKNGRTRRLTIVRRVYGDVNALAEQIKAEFPNIAKLEVKAQQQKIVIKGNMVDDLKVFLTNLGF